MVVEMENIEQLIENLEKARKDLCFKKSAMESRLDRQAYHYGANESEVKELEERLEELEKKIDLIDKELANLNNNRKRR